jgi:ParB-like nuclease domain
MSEPNKFGPEVVYRNPAELTPYAQNAKRHSNTQVDRLAGIIARFGFDVPIVVDGDGVIVKGHARREAALRLKMEKVPVVVRSDLTEHELMAARIADNRVAEGQEYDVEKLQLELGELQKYELDIAALVAPDVGRVAAPAAPASAEPPAKELPADPRRELLRTSMTFRTHVLPMSADTAERLAEAIEAYGDERGVLHGFVGALLDAYDEHVKEETGGVQ